MTEDTSEPDLIEPNKSIFNKKHVLDEDYQPENIVGRDDKINGKYREQFVPVVNGENPPNLFVYGKSGVGKSVVTRYLLNIVDKSAEKQDINLKIININCQDINTGYQAAICIINKLKPPEKQLSMSGYPEIQVYNNLWEELKKIKGSIIIVLDEIDNLDLRDNDTLLYKLSRAGEYLNTDKTKIGMIGISNDSSFRQTLSSKTTSSLRENEILFDPYNAEDINKVLEERAEKAFDDNVLSNEVIPLCSAFGAKEGGDARYALDLLEEAGKIARNRGSEFVEEQHVRKARKELERNQTISTIQAATKHEKLVLYSVLVNELKDPGYVSNLEIQKTYRSVCKRIHQDTVSKRRILDFLNEFETQGVLESEYKKASMKGGRTSHYQIKHDLNDTKNAIEDVCENVRANSDRSDKYVIR